MKMWIAQDKNGTTYLYKSKPEKILNTFIDTDGFLHMINSDLVPEVTFENSPMEVELIIRSNGKKG